MATNIISFIDATFTGMDDGGGVSVPGVKVGDVIISCYNSSLKTSGAAYFLPVVINDDELEQVVSGLNTSNFNVTLLRK